MRSFLRAPLHPSRRSSLLVVVAAGSVLAGSAASTLGQSPIYCPAEAVCPGFADFGPGCTGYGPPLAPFFTPCREPIVILPAPVFGPPAFGAPAFGPPLGMDVNGINPAPRIELVQPLDMPIWQRAVTAGPSTPEAKLNSLRTQQVGDRRFRKQDYAAAISRYRDAIAQAPDRGEVHLRLAVALIVSKRYEKAMDQLRLGLRSAPDLLDEPPSLDAMFGEENVLAKNNVLLRVGEWVKEEPFDAQRHYVLGLLMLLDGDAAAADKLFQRGSALGGAGDVLAAFLQADAADTGPGADAEP